MKADIDRTSGALAAAALVAPGAGARCKSQGQYQCVSGMRQRQSSRSMTARTAGTSSRE